MSCYHSTLVKYLTIKHSSLSKSSFQHEFAYAMSRALINPSYEICPGSWSEFLKSNYMMKMNNVNYGLQTHHVT